ncbi:MAG: hypothetical protein JNK15_12770 [Planctomycetes bacterium]|nr:hypothetical protein [Planctomycetota bacterium]
MLFHGITTWNSSGFVAGGLFWSGNSTFWRGSTFTGAPLSKLAAKLAPIVAGVLVV